MIRTKIGISRGLLYYYYFPLWKEFFNCLNIKTIVSPQTNKKILDQGVKKAVDDLCLPFKVYYGHVKTLIDKDIDYILLPRYLNLGKENKVCPKLMGLPDMLRAAYGEKLPPIIAPEIKLKRGIYSFRKIMHRIGKRLNINYFKVEYAFWRALKKQKKFKKIQNEGFTPVESIDKLNQKEIKKRKIKKTNKNNKVKIAVLGHSYMINDSYLSMDLIKHLRKMGVTVITQEMIKDKKLEKAASLQPKKLFWVFNRQIMGGAYYFLNNLRDKGQKIDGIIHVSSFGCGPDALTQELIEIKTKKRNNISLLNINLDEHSGQAGLLTRLEAFVDLLERRKKNE